ncbi:MAG TPA: hypothetical protein DCK87_03325, partial [Desulfotomaculum sp.]|nr:hypothetical protein [Desulfotomaculum sp.]
MQKETAKDLIQKTLKNSFNKERFIYFVKNLLNSIDELKAFHARGYVPEIFKDYVKTYERLGTYTDPEEKKIDILIVYLQRESTLERARTAQRNFIARYLKDRGEKDAGLIAFVSPNKDDWRFSFVKLEYTLTETPKGTVKAKEEFTPARRYSFLVGMNENSHTTQSRLLPLLLNDEVKPTLAELEETFSVERVTKEFFEKYRDLFLRLKESLDEIIKKDAKVSADFKEKNIDAGDFAKKLLGQIVFLCFLQKKGWFGVPRGKDWGEGDKKFLRNLFDKAQKENKNYFNRFLEPLFYEALRSERPKDYYAQFNCRIPFLNGGLFDPINDYDWQGININLPNEIFSNHRKTKEGDTGDGILDVFDRYNFTVKEDEPLEKEVAIDPEMLGKVFENLLEVKDRKSKGTYYTPREIVHYMCQESLVNYLVTELEGKASKEEIKTLIKYGETAVEHDSRVVNEGRETKDYSFKLPKSIRKHAKLIDEKLKTIRVCDPAVGSGAFVVGMMNEIIRTRDALTPYLFADERTPYNFKRQAIQNCLYGVDIDHGAVEIAKLRLWLSLIVDEEDIKKIKPLPNLDYKIMQGNSLLSEFMGINFDKEDDRKNQLFISQDEVNTLIEKLKDKKDEYLNKARASEKQQLKQEIEDLMITIFETKLQKQNTDYSNSIKDIEEKYKNLPNAKQRESLIQQERENLYKISGFNLDQFEKQLREYTAGNKLRPFFPWHLYFAEVFHEKKGFDVVIANPPYVSYGLRGGQKMSKTEKEFLRKHFPNSAEYKISLYAVFMDKGLQITKPDGGIEIYIVPDSFLLGRYFSKIREFILRTSEIINILLLPFSVFEATVGFSVVYLFQRKQVVNLDHQLTARFASSTQDVASGKFREHTYPQKLFHVIKHKRFRLLFSKSVMALISKIEANSDELGSFFTGRTGVRSLIGQKQIISDEKKGATWQRGLISGAQILKYKVLNQGNYINIDPKLLNKGGWDYHVINHPKILVRQTGDTLIAAIDYNGFYHLNNIHSFAPNPNNNERLDLLYLLALFNSKLLAFYYRNISLETERAMAQTDIETLESLPIKVISKDEQKPFVNLIDKILAITKDDDYLENPIKQDKVREYEKQ